MRKFIALLFAVCALAMAVVAPTASGSASYHSYGGVCLTATSHNGGANYSPGQAWHAYYYCF